MLFNSFEYFLLLFFAIVLFRKITNSSYKVWFLLATSYFVYALWGIGFLILLIFTTFIGFLFSFKVSPTQSKNARIWLTGGICLLICCLAYFKSANFLIYGSSNRILIPIGISFYSLQIISYWVDIYHGQIKPEESISKFSLYVAFFPQILAGPIERASALIPQFDDFKIKGIDFYIGFKLILIGLFQKVIVADKLALLVDPVYNNCQSFNGTMILLATIGFSFQIYCDFSGYTKIALGSARLFGIKLSQNFDRPYLATGAKDFWNRWHISLSKWFRDYVYFPLGGNRKTKLRWALNILIVFLISGFWHGIGITFMLWGLGHALFYLIDTYLKEQDWKIKIPKLVSQILTFSCVTFLWCFFRANSFNDAYYICSQITTLFDFEEIQFYSSHFFEISKLNLYSLGLILMFWGSFIIMDSSQFLTKFISRPLLSQPKFEDLFLINFILFLLIVFGDWGGEQFIYFQF